MRKGRGDIPLVRETEKWVSTVVTNLKTLKKEIIGGVEGNGWNTVNLGKG